MPCAFILFFSRTESSFQKYFLRDITIYSLSTGLVTALITVGISLYSVIYLGNNSTLNRTFIIAVIVFMGIFNFLNVYTNPKKLKNLFNIKAIFASVVFLSFFPLSIYLFERARYFFDFTYLTTQHWMIILLVLVIGFVLFYLVYRYHLIYRIFATKEDQKEYEKRQMS